MASYHTERKTAEQFKIKEMLSEMPYYVTRYLYSIQNSTTTRTQISYLTDIKNFLCFISDASCRLSEVRTESLRDVTIEMLDNVDRTLADDYMNYLRQYEKDGKVYTNDTASLKRKLSAITSLFSYLYMSEMIKENVFTKVRQPKLRKKNVIRLDEKETESLMNLVEADSRISSHHNKYHQKNKARDMAIISLFLSTGIRVSELVGINLSDIDMERYSIRIVRKGNKGDIVYFSDECASYLSEYLGQRRKMVALEGNEGAFFLSMQLKRISVRAVEVLIKQYSRQAVPLKNITPHKLRSTYGTRFYEETNDIYLTAKKLGHNSVDTTSKYYVSTEKGSFESRNAVSLKNVN